MLKKNFIRGKKVIKENPPFLESKSRERKNQKR